MTDTAREDPLALFQRWYDDAVAAGLREPEAMALATATPDGRPSVRYVLFRGLDAEGLHFYTNYESRKARELEANPWAAVVFLWEPPGRQVRIEGAIERLPAATSDAYFASRPRGHQVGAWASPQSQPLARPALEARHVEALERFASGPVPRPPYWGGYRLRAHQIELWERGSDRLHRRRSFTRTPAGWTVEELAP